MERPPAGATKWSNPAHCVVMEGRVKTYRTILAAVAVAALAGSASLAQHGGGKSAPRPGAAQSAAPGASEGATHPGKDAPNAGSEGDNSARRSPLPRPAHGDAHT